MSADSSLPQSNNGYKTPKVSWLTHNEIAEFLRQFHTKQQNSQDIREAARTVAMNVIQAAIDGQPDEYDQNMLCFALRWAGVAR